MPSLIEHMEHRIVVTVILTTILSQMFNQFMGDGFGGHRLLLQQVMAYDLQELPLSPRQVQTKYGILRGVIIPLRTSSPPPSSSVPPLSSSSSQSLPTLAPVEAFLGVAYAAPPLKTLRFMPPVTLSKWKGVRLATRFSPVCMQRIPDVRNVSEALRTMSATRVDYIRRLQPFVANQSEDCLYLNIYIPHTPTISASSTTSSGSSANKYGLKYPVIVFIGGESYDWANGNSYDGSVLASYGQVVVITVNYRLGVFGFLPSILDGSVRGNYGLMDQVAALHWIQESISEFGGDANNVTLIGHGYGSACAHLLMLSPMARGLFTRVVLMSGSALSPWAIARSSDTYSTKLAKQLNCPTHDNIIMVECLRYKPVDDIWSVDLMAPQYLTTFGPIIDGILVPSEPKHILETGLSDFDYYFHHHNHTPASPVPVVNTPIFNSQSVHYINNYDLLVGVTRVEAPYIFSAHEERHGIDSVKRDRILRTLVRNFFDFQQQSIYLTLMNEYTDWNRPVEHPINLLDSTVDILGDALRVASVVESGDLHSRWTSSESTTPSQQQQQHIIGSTGSSSSSSGVSTGGDIINGRNARIYFYVFAYQSDDGNKLLHQRLGCLHGEELAYLFGAPLAVQLLGRTLGHFAVNYSKPEVTLSEAVMTYWINFAKYGDPNVWPHEFDQHGDRTKGRFENVVWPQYDATHKKYLMIGMKPKVRDHYHSHRLSFWLHLIPKLHKPGGDEDIYLRHHLLHDHENLQSYDGRVRQIAFKFLEPLPTAAAAPVAKHNNNMTNQTAIKSLNYKPLSQHSVDDNDNNGDNGFAFSTPLSSLISTDQIGGSVANTNRSTAATAMVMDGNGSGGGNYTTALTVTIAIGCSLLFLNILIFAGIYYQLNSSKMRTKRTNNKKYITNFECSSPSDDAIMLSSTCGTSLRASSQSPPVSLSPTEAITSGCGGSDLTTNTTLIDNCLDSSCPESSSTLCGIKHTTNCPFMTTLSIAGTGTLVGHQQKGILKHNKWSSNTRGEGAGQCPQVQKCCCNSCHYTTRVPELRYDPIGVESCDGYDNDT